MWLLVQVHLHSVAGWWLIHHNIPWHDRRWRSFRFTDWTIPFVGQLDGSWHTRGRGRERERKFGQKTGWRRRCLGYNLRLSEFQTRKNSNFRLGVSLSLSLTPFYFLVLVVSLSLFHFFVLKCLTLRNIKERDSKQRKKPDWARSTVNVSLEIHPLLHPYFHPLVIFSSNSLLW